MPHSKRLQPLLGFLRLSHDNLVQRGYQIYYSLRNNPAFPNLPISMADFKAALDAYAIAIALALDGGQKAIVARDEHRMIVLGMIRQLGHYVEGASNNDPHAFETSGFDALPASKRSPEETPRPRILKIRHGSSGELFVSVSAHYRKIKYYELEYRERNSDDTEGEPKSVQFTASRPATRVAGLKPGPLYVLRVRAFGRLGFSDWSDAVTKICT